MNCLVEDESVLELLPFGGVVYIVDGAGFSRDIIVADDIVIRYIVFVAEP